MRRTEYTPSSYPLLTLIKLIETKALSFNPSYQREVIWKKEMKYQLIETIFLNMPIGSAIIWDNTFQKEVIDGMQRITTIKEFMDDKFSIPSGVSRNIIKNSLDELEQENSPEAKKFLKKYINNESINIKYSKLPILLKIYFDTYQMSVIEIRYTNELNIRNFFIKVQNQEKLKAGEIIRSIPENAFIRKINNFDISFISEKIGFNNSRKDLEKILVMFHGLFLGKLSLNASEKQIIAYAAREKEMSNLFEHRINIIKNNLKKSRILNIKQKNELKIFLIGLIFSDKFINIPIDSFEKATKKFIKDTKVLNSNDPLFMKLKNNFIKKYPKIYEVSMILKGQQTKKKIDNLIKTFETVLIDMIEMQ